MLDSIFNPWLIEVNATPAMDYSTPITERLVKLMSEDTAKVLIDYEEGGDTVDTGLWNLLERGNYV
jgi:tubulin monoglycylase TTLL3/8